MRVKAVKRAAKSPELEYAGRSLTEYRARAGYTLEQAAKALGMSSSYLSEVENGIKIPSDIVIRNMANLYGVDERVLFKKFGKIPLGVYEELEKNDTLQKTISEIRYNQALTEEQKQALYDEMYRLYKDAIEGKL